MGERREYAQRYKKLWKSLSNWLKNSSGWKVGGVTKEGSRREGDFKNRSDLDMSSLFKQKFEDGYRIK